MYKSASFCLVAICQPTHTAHDTENVVVTSVYAYLSGVGARYSCVGKNKLEGCVVDARHVAGSRWLVLLRAECERVYVDTSLEHGCGVAMAVLGRSRYLHAQRSGPGR